MAIGPISFHAGKVRFLASVTAIAIRRLILHPLLHDSLRLPSLSKRLWMDRAFSVKFLRLVGRDAFYIRPQFTSQD